MKQKIFAAKTKKYICIILCAITIYSFFSSMAKHRDIYTMRGMENWIAEADNLFFPIYHLDPMVFPFQKLFQSIIFTHLPKCLSFFKLIVFFSPAALAFIAGAAHSVLAGTLSAFFICFLQHTDLYDSRSLEQLIISSCLLASIATAFNFKDKPRWRIIILSLSLAALAQSKGVFFPLVFLFVIYEAIIRHNNKKRIWPALLLVLPFLLSGITWNIIAVQQNPNISVFFTESGNRLLPNLMAGAMGLVGTTEGSTWQVFNKPSIHHALFIAAVHIMEHPVIYLKSICERFVFLAENAKFIYILVPLWLSSIAILIRQRSRFILLPLCAAYCFAIYIIMPVEQRYFVPAWFLMCACAGISISHIFLNLQKHLPKKACQILKENKNISEKTISLLFGVFFLPHVFIWITSIILLITFPLRYKSFDIDKAYSIFPNNRYLELCPLRKTYPRIWDYAAALEFLKKNSDNLTSQMYKARWLEYFSPEKKEQEHIVKPDIPITIFSGKEYLTWPDILLKSVQNYKAGNYKEADRLAGAAALSCMLNSGYVRTYREEDNSYNDEEKEYADRLAIASADVCASQLNIMFSSIPPWEHKLKEIMMENSFGKYLEEKNLISLYEEKESSNCKECCVPNGFLKVPSKCGFAVNHFVSAYDCLEEHICKGKHWCRGQINPTPQEIYFCKELTIMIEKDIDLSNKYPILKRSYYSELIAEAALTSALADIKAGDRANAAMNLRHAIAICPKIVNTQGFKYAYNYMAGK